MRPRQLNYLRHPITSRQALDMFLECWMESRKLPIMIVSYRGDAEESAKRIRVALSKEKAKISKADRPHYGFTISDPFPYTDGGRRGEAVVIRYRMTSLQHFRNIADEILPPFPAMKGLENAN